MEQDDCWQWFYDERKRQEVERLMEEFRLLLEAQASLSRAWLRGFYEKEDDDVR